MRALALGWDPVRLAVGTLTVLPTRPVRRIDASVAGTAMLIAPLAVVPLAGVAAAAGWLARVVGAPPLLCGLLVVGVLALGTRALHLDGLADTVDGLGSGWDRDKALTVMRRGDVGPMGVVALFLVLAGQAAALGALVDDWRSAVEVALLVCCSRAALALVCARGVIAARPDGLGAAVAGSVPRWAAAMSWLLVTVVLGSTSVWRGSPWWSGLLASALAVLLVTVLMRRCMSRFGGVTGDVMGAAVEVAFTVLVVVTAG